MNIFENFREGMFIENYKKILRGNKRIYFTFQLTAYFSLDVIIAGTF